MKDDFDFSKLKKVKRINSRTKGNTFERKICKLLNEKFYTEEFQRSPGSGAFGTTHTLPEHLQIYGDLITPQKFKFIIECKKGYNKIFLGDVLSEKCEVYEFFQQAITAANKAKRQPILIIQQDRKDVLCVMQGKVEGVISIQLPFMDLHMMYLEDLLLVYNQYFFTL